MPPKRKAHVITAAAAEGVAAAEEDSKRYDKKEQRQHILDLPDTYIGSTVPGEVETWVIPDGTASVSGSSAEALATDHRPSCLPSVVYQKIHVSLGLYKIVDEIFQNAVDNVFRVEAARKTNPSLLPTTQIKVAWQDDGRLSVWNNGEGIPIVEHTQHKTLIPSMIFGELLSSGNYDAQEQKRWGGRNGLGAKATSIFSREFVLETVDRVRQKKLVQTWWDNMSRAGPAQVTNYTGSPYTRITFWPDYARFGCENLTPDLRALLRRRVYDLAGLAHASVFLNGHKIPLRHFQHFTELFLDKTLKRVYEAVTDPQDPSLTVWEVVACPSPDGTFRQVSYVNGISTFQGGRHVDYVTNKITKKLCDLVNAKMTKAQTPLQQKHVKNNLWLFLSASVVNPAFSSQTKEYLTTTDLPPCELSDGFYAKLAKSEVVERAKLLKDFHEQRLLAKTDGRKTRTVTGIEKLEDANEAGGRQSRQCTLIVCEGDSARTFAVSGLGVVGRDFWGVYPLKGKLLNVRDASTKDILENKEIQELKKILGLREDVASADDLRYRELMVLTDEDEDGIHIKALILNFLEVHYPQILRSGFVVSMYTPLIKVRRGERVVATFFNRRDFERWKASQTLEGLEVRYYKGLGTHDPQEARECFQHLQKIKYHYDDRAGALLSMGFDKKAVDQRKRWIAQHHHQPLDYEARDLPISEFIDKGLILFSNADNVRSIPSFMDGLKPSQRKVLCGVLTRNQVSSIKVSQLAGPISSAMSYHHGEKSLESTIVNMAQTFVGSNNVNLLRPQGQFGTRLKGGGDAASSRYIFTSLAPVARKIFRREDDPLLTYRSEDDKVAEPTFYWPVIPMVLVNGTSGIGTGFSTSIPNHNPLELIAQIRAFLRGQPLQPLTPYYRHFKGTVVWQGDRFVSQGVWARLPNHPRVIHITELPLGVWTDHYKAFLDKAIEGGGETGHRKKSVVGVVRYKVGTYQDEKSVDLQVELDQDYSEDQVVEGLRLSESKTCHTHNMHVFDPHGHLAKFPTTLGLLTTFCHYRLHFYECRRRYRLQVLEREMRTLAERIRFIQGLVDQTLVILNQTKLQVVTTLREQGFAPYPLADPVVIDPVPVAAWVAASEPHVVHSELYSRDYSGVQVLSRSSVVETEGLTTAAERSAVEDPASSPPDLLPPASLSSYRYLTSTSVYHMTREEIVILRDQYQHKQRERDRLETLTAADLWLQDLEELEVELQKL